MKSKNSSLWCLITLLILMSCIFLIIIFKSFVLTENKKTNDSQIVSIEKYELIYNDGGYFDLYEYRGSGRPNCGIFVNVIYKVNGEEKRDKFQFRNTEFVEDESNFVEIFYIDDGSVWGKYTYIIHTTEDISYIAPLKEKMSKHVYEN